MCKATTEIRDLIASGFAENDQKNTALFQDLRRVILLQDAVQEDFKKETRKRLDKMEESVEALVEQNKQSTAALLTVAKSINGLSKELHGGR